MSLDKHISGSELSTYFDRCDNIKQIEDDQINNVAHSLFKKKILKRAATERQCYEMTSASNDGDCTFKLVPTKKHQYREFNAYGGFIYTNVQFLYSDKATKKLEKDTKI